MARLGARSTLLGACWGDVDVERGPVCDDEGPFAAKAVRANFLAGAFCSRVVGVPGSVSPSVLRFFA